MSGHTTGSLSPDEAYISVDIETAGPVPGQYSMLAVGACLVEAPTHHFYAELRPISDSFIPEAIQVTGLSLEHLRANGKLPSEALGDLARWVARVSRGRRPVFVGFNASFDWAFVNWYFHTFVGNNPFGIGGIDIKSYYMGLTGCSWGETSSSNLPEVYRPTHVQTHNALDDARAQGEMFAKMVASHRPT